MDTITAVEISLVAAVILSAGIYYNIRRRKMLYKQLMTISSFKIKEKNETYRIRIITKNPKSEIAYFKLQNIDELKRKLKTDFPDNHENILEDIRKFWLKNKSKKINKTLTKFLQSIEHQKIEIESPLRLSLKSAYSDKTWSNNNSEDELNTVSLPIQDIKQNKNSKNLTVNTLMNGSKKVKKSIEDAYRKQSQKFMKEGSQRYLSDELRSPLKDNMESYQYQDGDFCQDFQKDIQIEHNDNNCDICHTNKKQYSLVPCGHLYCLNCIVGLNKESCKCKFCGKDFKSIEKKDI